MPGTLRFVQPASLSAAPATKTTEYTAENKVEMLVLCKCKDREVRLAKLEKNSRV